MICILYPFASCFSSDLLHLLSSSLSHFHCFSHYHVFFPSIKVIRDLYLKKTSSFFSTLFGYTSSKSRPYFLITHLLFKQLQLVIKLFSPNSFNSFLIAKFHTFLSPRLSFFSSLFDGVPSLILYFSLSVFFLMDESSPSSCDRFSDSHCRMRIVSPL